MRTTLKDLVPRIVGWAAELAIFIGLLFGAAIFLEALLNILIAVTSLLTRAFGGLGAKIIITIGVLGAGALAHWFKKKNQQVYGNVEVLFGTVAPFKIVSGKSSPTELLFVQWAALVGCIYVVARGFSNRSDGRAKVLKELKRP